MRRRRATSSASPTIKPGLRTAEQFVAAERNQVHAGIEAFRNARLGDPEGRKIGDAAAAQILIERQAAFAGERGQLAERGLGGESFDVKIAGMNAHQQTGALADRGAIIVEMGAVGGARLRAAPRPTRP